MKSILQYLTIVSIILFSFSVNAQLPIISYITPDTFYVGTAITPLVPTNTGGAITYGLVRTLAGSGTIGATDATGTAASFNQPTGLVYNKGNIYVADARNNLIRKISSYGIVSTIAGSGIAGTLNGMGTSASFNNPTGVTVDPSGNVYVADQLNNMIREIDISVLFVNTLAGSGSIGAKDTISYASTFSNPFGVVSDKYGNVYIADTYNNKIRKIGAGNYYTTTFAGNGTFGYDNSNSSTSSFGYPSGLAIDALNNIYVADAGNNLIRKITAGGNVSNIAGIAGVAGSLNGIGTSASFNNPTGVAVDLNGNIYVADAGNNLIRKISSYGIVSTIAGSGIAGTLDGMGTSASFNNPTGVTVDPSGNLYVADQLNNKIRKILSGYSIYPALPKGLSLDEVTGVISGTPTVASVSTKYIISAINASGTANTHIILGVICLPTSSTTNMTLCSSSLPYYWNGLYFNPGFQSGGSLTAHLTNKNGCDSAATLVLTVNMTTSSSTPISICPVDLPYSWNGNSYTKAGSYIVHLTNSVGCDSAATLILTVKPISSSSTPVSVCAASLPYIWNGNNYTGAGTYTIHLVNNLGCDSATTLVLTVNNATISTTNKNTCNSYTWNGVTYNATGVYTKTFAGGNKKGCDSIATLNLVINQITPTINIVNLSSCNKVIYKTKTYTTSTVVRDTVKSYQSCDSIYNIGNITITKIVPLINTLSLSGCNSVLYKSIVYTNSAIVRDTVKSYQGFDSIYNIGNITVNKITPTLKTVNINGCNSVTYKSVVYTTTTIVSDTVKSYQGCDSIYNVGNIVVTKITPTNNVVNLSGCNSVVYKGKVYTSSTTVLDTVRSFLGCDSIYNTGNIIVTKISSITNNINLNGCNSLVYKGIIYYAPTVVRDTVKSYQGCDSIYNVANVVITKVTPVTNTINMKGCDSILYNGKTYTTSTIVRDTVRSFLGCDSIYNIGNIVLLGAVNCGGYLQLVSDTAINYFGDTLHVMVNVKNGVNVFSTYAYLSFDTTYLKLYDSKAGSYLGNQTINQPPVVNGDKINFGLTKTSGQIGSNGDGTVYEFRFLLKQLPVGLPFMNALPLPFTLSNLTVYNAVGSSPSSFNQLSMLSDTTLCRYNVQVWPGDLNDDKKVNVADLLPIGYFYGSTGAARPNANLAWTTQPAILWGFDISTNTSSAYKVFADGNGDGVIDLADQAAIGFNLNRYHARLINNAIVIPATNFLPNTPAVNVSLPDTVISSSSLPYNEKVNISLGSTSLPLNGLYGVALDIYFDPTYVNTAAIITDYTNSIFGTAGTNFTKLEDFSNIATGKLSIGITRFNTTAINATGGTALNITLPLISGAPNGWFKVSAIPIACNDQSGINLTITGSADSLYVGTLLQHYSLSGNLVNPLGKSINGTTVLLNGTGTLFNNNFTYPVTSSSNALLKAFKNNDMNKTNGVTTLDIAFTQSHILGKNLLNSPYKLIAADVNGDGKVSTLDIVYMKRLILGIDTTFTKAITGEKRLWAFVDSNYTFPDITNPFPFKDSISYTGLSVSKTNQTFIGCKLGDVNWDWNPAVAKPMVYNLNALELYYTYPSDALPGRTDWLQASDEVRIPIRVKNFKELLGLQYTLNFNAAALKFVGVNNKALTFEAGTNHAAEGKISFLWVDAKNEVKTLEDGSVLFELVFKKMDNGGLIMDNGNTNALSVDGSVTAVAAYDKDYSLHDVVMKNAPITIVETATESWVVAPNPTKDGVIQVQMNLSNNKIIVFRLLDEQGRLLLTKQVEGVKGSNHFTLREGNIASGTYYLQAVGVEGVKQLRIEN